MPRPQGSGRKKGTPNKDAPPCAEIAAKLGIEPFEVLLRFAAGDWEGLGYAEERYVTHMDKFGTYVKWTIDPAVRARAAAEATKYLHTQLRATEITGDLGITLKVEDYTE